MSDQSQSQSVVGEDGELIQADITVDEDAYAEYIATYVHRDPLWFRTRNHIREYGCMYLFVTFGCFGCSIVQIVLSGHGLENFGIIILLILVLGAMVIFGQKILNNDMRQ